MFFFYSFIFFGFVFFCFWLILMCDILVFAALKFALKFYVLTCCFAIVWCNVQHLNKNDFKTRNRKCIQRLQPFKVIVVQNTYLRELPAKLRVPAFIHEGSIFPNNSHSSNQISEFHLILLSKKKNKSASSQNRNILSLLTTNKTQNIVSVLEKLKIKGKNNKEIIFK